MNGFINQKLAVLSLAAGLVVFAGCQGGPGIQAHYYDWRDPCWPQRYSAMASDAVCSAFGPQVNNGHVLDQTIWNYHFYKGTAELTPGGQAELARIARRRPAPDPQIYLQTAYDVAYDPNDPDSLTVTREKLDNERHQEIIKFLQAHSGGRGIAFTVSIHDPSEVGMGAAPMLQSISERDSNFEGVLPLSGIGGSVGATGGGGF